MEGTVSRIGGDSYPLGTGSYKITIATLSLLWGENCGNHVRVDV
jgi:hypothetical protein